MTDVENKAWSALYEWLQLNNGPYNEPLIEAVRDLIDPPVKIYTSLRGWVLWTRSQDDDMRFVMWAADNGLCESPDSLQPMFGWEEFARRHEQLTPLTPEDIGYKVRRWGELIESDRIRFEELRWKTDDIASRHVYEVAIDIATRREG